MDENNPEESSIKEEEINSFYNFKNCKNVFEHDKETEFSLKLSTTAVAESISGPSTSQQAIYTKNGNPVKKSKKGKAKILSVVHIPSPIDNIKGRHVPIILQKSHKFKLKVKKQKAIFNLVTSTPERSIQYKNPVVINSAQKNTLNIPELLNEPGETPTNDPLVAQVSNSDRIQNRNLNQTVPFDISQQEQNYSTNSNNFSNQRTSSGIQLANICEKKYYGCEMPLNLVFASKKVGNGYLATHGQIGEVIPKVDDLNLQQVLHSDTSFDNTSSDASGTYALQNDRPNSEVQALDSVKKIYQFVKIKRLVSILKSNQPNINLTTPVMNLQGNASDVPDITTLAIEEVEKYPTDVSEMEMETEAASSELETTTVSETSESGVSFLSETLSSEKSQIVIEESSPQESSLSVTDADSFVTVSSLTGNDTTTNLEYESTPSDIEPKITAPEMDTTFGVQAFSPKSGDFDMETFSPEIQGSKIKATFANGISESDEIESVLKAEIGTTLVEMTSYNSKIEMKLNISESDEANSSELVTVASDDIPYNAEVEIDSNEANKSGEVNFLNITPINNATDSNKKLKKNENNNNNYESKGIKMDNNDDNYLEFNVLKEKSKRILFLEKEDVEFCKAAQRKVKDESPATVHALMVACMNEVGPVLDHLRYIQKNREILRDATRNNSVSSQSTDDSSSSSINESFGVGGATQSQGKANPFIATKQADVGTPNTRKKKISYNLDLSDNYADDSDEDYVPGQDLIPKKKKRVKRRHFSAKNKILPFEKYPFHQIPGTSSGTSGTSGTSIAEAAAAAVAVPPPNIQLDNEGEEEGSLSNQHPCPMDRCSESSEDKRIIRYNRTHRKRCSAAGGDGTGASADVDAAPMQENKVIYKAEPLPKENLELVKFKKKKTFNSYVVPPIQKFMYAHEGVENLRYMTLSKQ